MAVPFVLLSKLAERQQSMHLPVETRGNINRASANDLIGSGKWLGFWPGMNVLLTGLLSIYSSIHYSCAPYS